MSDLPVGRDIWNQLLRRIERRTRNRVNAEDLLHSAYLRLEAYRSANPVRDPGAFLLRTALNIGVDNYRHDRMAHDHAARDGLDETDRSPLQDEVVAARDRLERVKRGLAHLTPRTRQVFLMHRLDNLKYHEIAARLGISQSAVEKHIAKAALHLASWMEGW